MPLATCPTREELSSYVLGKLPDDSSAEFDEHLLDCTKCQTALETLAISADSLLADLQRPAAEQEFFAEAECREAMALVQAIGREPSLAGARSSEAPPANESDLGQIRDYKLIAKLGEGGMGAVYKALHVHLNKVVALKVLPKDRTDDKQAVARFKREMLAVGALEHANIVRATDAGEHEGTHFLVMEYVPGQDLSQISRQYGPLPIADACELIRQAAVGLQHAHEHGLIHRDIKPSNLMLSWGRASSLSMHKQDVRAGEPIVKILDLGLALLQEHHAGKARDLTATGQLMGTLDYMAPEQVDDSHEVDVRADIYSLGATLYKLLSGQSPFPSDKYRTPLRLLNALANEQVASILEKRNDLPDQLVSIVDRMLAKQPADRFATPEEVAKALTPLTTGANLEYLAEQVCSTELATDLDQSAIGTRDHITSDSKETDLPLNESTPPSVTETQPPKRQSAVELGLTSPSPQSPALQADESPSATKPLATSAQRSGWWTRNRKTTAVLLGLAALVAGIAAIVIQTNKGTIRIVSYDPDVEVTVKRNGQVVDGFQIKQRGDATSYFSGEYEVEIKGGKPDGVSVKNDRFTLTRGQEVLVEITRRRQESAAEATTAAQVVNWVPGPAGDVLPGIVSRPANLPGIKRWQVETIRPRTNVFTVSWSPDGQLVACGTLGGQVRIYDGKTRELVRILPGHKRLVHTVAWSPDGQHLVSASTYTIRLWHRNGTPGPVFRLGNRSTYVYSVAWHPDGQKLAAGVNQNVFWLKLDGSAERFTGDIGDNAMAVAWNHTGDWFATGGPKLLQLWKADGTPGPQFDGHSATVWRLAWHPNGKQIAAGTDRKTVRIWNVDGTAGPILEADSQRVDSVVWTPDGQRIVTGGLDASLRFWSADGKLLKTVGGFASDANSIAWDPTTNRIAVASANLYFLDSDGNRLARIDGHAAFAADLAWRPDGRQLASATTDALVRLWSPEGDQVSVLHSDQWRTRVESVSWSPDGERFAAACVDVSIHSAKGVFQKSLQGHTRAVFSVAWSPTGERLLSAGNDGTVRIWNADGTIQKVLDGHEGDVRNLTWADDGRHFVSSDYSTTRLWDVDGNLKATVDGSPGVLSPDGTKIAAATRDESGSPATGIWNVKDTSKPTITIPVGVYYRMFWAPAGDRLAWHDDYGNLYVAGANGTIQQIFDHGCSEQSGSTLAWHPDGNRLASVAMHHLSVRDLTSGAVLWTAVLLDNEKSVTFSPAGQVLYADPTTVETRLVVIVENEDGCFELLKPSEFEARIGQSFHTAVTSTNRP